MDIKTGDNIQLRKIAIADKPNAPTPDSESYVYGEDNPGVSVPLAYEIEGKLLQDVVVGLGMSIQRTKRNGVSIPGHMLTSPVTEITSTGSKVFVHTTNSVYEMIKVN